MNIEINIAITFCDLGHKILLGLADRLCHISQNPNPNDKAVSGFQNLLKRK